MPAGVRSGRCQRQLVGLAGAVGILFDGGTELFHRRSGFFQRAGLFFGAGTQVVVAGGHLTTGQGDRLAALAHAAHDARHRRAHGGDVAQQAALVAGAQPDVDPQIPLGHAARDLAGVGRLTTELEDDAARDRHADPQQQQAQPAHQSLAAGLAGILSALVLVRRQHRWLF